MPAIPALDGRIGSDGYNVFLVLVKIHDVRAIPGLEKILNETGIPFGRSGSEYLFEIINALDNLGWFPAAHAFREDIHQQEVRIGAARNHAEAFLLHARGQYLRISHHLPLVFDELRRHGFEKAHRLGGDHMHQRSALHAGEDTLVDGGPVFFLREDEAGSRPAQRLVRRGRHNVGVFARVGMQSGGHQPREVRHVDQQDGAHRIGDFAEFFEIPLSRISAAARDDHLRLVLGGELRHVIEIDTLVVRLLTW